MSRESGMFQPAERVILGSGNPFEDGLRGTVQSVSDDESGTAVVRWDDGRLMPHWFSKLYLEAESPDYPQPGPWINEPPVLTTNGGKRRCEPRPFIF